MKFGTPSASAARLVFARARIVFGICLALAYGLHAQPAQYFSSAYGLDGDALKLELRDLIDGNTAVSYTPGVWEAHKDLYEDPANPANIILFYSGASISKSLQDSGSSPSNYWNREHLWPNSYGIDNSVSQGYTDLFHLVPAYKGVNSARGNKYFDEVSPGDAGYTFPAHVLAPACATNTDAWEPGDAQKGWVARAMLYMTTRYSSLQLIDTPPSPAPDSSSNRMAQLSIMLDWNRRFLPADREHAINERIYTTYQHNRNPYIDFPEFADAIWVSGPSWGAWRLAHFSLEELLDPQVSGDLADPDGDELNNLLEMALYSDPRTVDLNPPITGFVSGNTLHLSFERANSDASLNLVLLLESSTDFAEWDEVPLDNAVITPLSATRESLSIELPVSPDTPRFYRLRASRP